ncbi:MAG: TonB family protein [Gemmatimonadales bacterium]
MGFRATFVSAALAVITVPLFSGVHLTDGLNAQERRGTILGIVRDSAGHGVAGATIEVVRSEQRATTDAAGRFRLSGIAPGEVELHVRRLGFYPAAARVMLTAGAQPEVDVTLSPAPTRLVPVEVVEARKEVYDSRLAGFNDRKTKGVGHFVTRDRLEKLHSNRFMDVMREVPGVRVKLVRGGGRSLLLRGATCDPLVFIDGSPASAGVVDLDMIDLSTVEGIEIYAGLASIPAEFVSARGNERCGVIAVWSRPYRSRVNKQSTAGRSAQLEATLASLSVYTADQVDIPASLIPGSAAVHYPDSLMQEGVPGRVVVELVVNTDGSLDGESVRLVSSTHPLFTDAVQSALSAARFHAALIKARPVRQLLQLPFVFAPKS